MDLIASTAALAEACLRLSQHPFVTVDTEFMRETTYYPKLCLVQMARPDERRCSSIRSRPASTSTPFLALMADERVVKVFHAAAAGPRDRLESRRLRPAPAVRHPGRGDGLRLRRFGLLRAARQRPRQGAHRQVVALHRLVAPAAHRRRSSSTRSPTSPTCVDCLRGACRELGGERTPGWLDEEMAVLTSPETYGPSPRTPGGGSTGGCARRARSRS